MSGFSLHDLPVLAGEVKRVDAFASRLKPAVGKVEGESVSSSQSPAFKRVLPAVGEGVFGVSFWGFVRELRKRASEQISKEDVLLDEASRLERGRAIILQVVTDFEQERISSGDSPWDDLTKRDLVKAVFDAVFRLGRLQPLIDRADVENIEIYGFDRVLLQRADGVFEQASPVAESDEDLIDTLRFLASRDASDERPFSPAHPTLEKALPGRARLAAIAFDTPRPRVTIRLQHLQDVSLASLVSNGTLTPGMGKFLDAAIKGRKNVVVSGQGQGSGKTTLLRALAKCVDGSESVATIETDYELYLHEDPHFLRVLALQERIGSGEVDAGGRRIGQISASERIRIALRHNIDRIIVGEVRGSEILAMLTAMQAGNGSLSTVHADSAEQVPSRLVTLALEHGDATEEFAYRAVSQSINLVVFVSVDRSGEKKRRFVSKVLEVVPSESGRVGFNTVFGPDEFGNIVYQDAPTFLNELGIKASELLGGDLR